MACSIKLYNGDLNKVADVIAENGKRSILFSKINSLPFVKTQEEALELYASTKTSQFKKKNKNLVLDANKEPILYFKSLSEDSDFNENQFTESFDEAFNSDRQEDGVIVGFLNEDTQDIEGFMFMGRNGSMTSTEGFIENMLTKGVLSTSKTPVMKTSRIYSQTDVDRERYSIEWNAKINNSFLKAPNGLDSNLTPEQWITVRTENFKRWFGDWENSPEIASKFLDSNGEPKIMYQISVLEDTIFENRESALEYVSNIKNPEILKVFASIKNPKEDAIRIKSKLDFETQGVDGLVSPYSFQITAFYSDQIKSADDTFGTTNLIEDEARFQMGETNMNRRLINALNPVYSALFLAQDEVERLKKKFPPTHPNEFYHHSTIEFRPDDISNIEFGIYKPIKILGRLVNENVDVLVVDNPKSKNKYPHITLSTAEGIKPFQSNRELITNENQIEWFDKPINVYASEGIFDGKNDITSLVQSKKFNLDNKEKFSRDVPSYLKEAMMFAIEAHGDQKRKYTNLPYYVHLQEVTNKLLEYTSDEDVLTAALLHDTLEDTDVTFDEIKDKFGLKVANIVQELTDEYVKDKYPDLNRKERKRLELERLSKVSDDAKLIKAADRLNNIQDIAENDPKFAVKYLQESSNLAQGINNNELSKKLIAQIDSIQAQLENVQLTEPIPQLLNVDVNKLFEQKPELAKSIYRALGFNQKITPQEKQQVKELYSEYLNTLFPDSKVLGVFYHGTESEVKFDRFKSNKGGIHVGTIKAAKDRLDFEDMYTMDELLDRIYPVIINIENLSEGRDYLWAEYLVTDQDIYDELYKTESEADAELRQLAITYYHDGKLTMSEAKEFIRSNDINFLRDILDTDGYVYTNKLEDEGSKSYTVFNPSQAHILGTRQDVSDFKRFVQNRNSQYPIEITQAVFEILRTNFPMTTLVTDQKEFNRRLAYELTRQEEQAKLIEELESQGDVADTDQRVQFHIVGEEAAISLDRLENSTRRIDLLVKAVHMEQSDVKPLEIYLATGWQRGADKKWNFEISDISLDETQLEYREETNTLSNEKEGKLGNLVNNAEALFGAYPDMKDINVSITISQEEPERGFESLQKDMFTEKASYNYGLNEKGEIEEFITLNLNKDDAIDLPLLHEIQHAIQRREGFNQSMPFNAIKNLFTEAKRAERLIDSSRSNLARRRRKISYLLKKYDRFERPFTLQITERDAYESTVSKNRRSITFNTKKELGDYIGALSREYGEYKFDTQRRINRRALTVQHFKDKFGLTADMNISDVSPYKLYISLIGEVQADNVEERNLLTPQEKKNTLISATESISREDQIYMFEKYDLSNLIAGTVGADTADRVGLNLNPLEAKNRLQRLSEAKAAKLEGKDPLSIKKATGWELTDDSIWKHEIGSATLRPSAVSSDGTPLSEYTEMGRERLVSEAFDGEWLTWYPNLKNKLKYEVVASDDPMLSGGLGSYDESENLIRISSDLFFIAAKLYKGQSMSSVFSDRFTNTMNHEIQHAIQNEENFPRGYAPEGFAYNLEVIAQEMNEPTELDEVYKTIESLQGKMKIFDGMDITPSKPVTFELNPTETELLYRHARKMGNESILSRLIDPSEWNTLKKPTITLNSIDDLEYMQDFVDDLSVGYWTREDEGRNLVFPSPSTRVQEVVRLMESQYGVDLRTLDVSGDPKNPSQAVKDLAYEMYWRTSGEVEARIAADRRGLTETERLNTLLDNYKDVAEGDLIFIEENLPIDNIVFGDEVVVEGRTLPTRMTDLDKIDLAAQSTRDIIDTPRQDTIEELSEAAKDKDLNSNFVNTAFKLAKGVITVNTKDDNDNTITYDYVLPYKNTKKLNQLIKIKDDYNDSVGKNSDIYYEKYIGKKALEESIKNKETKKSRRETVRAILKSRVIEIASEINEEVTKVFTDNLDSLLGEYEKQGLETEEGAWIERSKTWYEGANRVAKNLVDKYTRTIGRWHEKPSIETVAAVIAVQSPQNDWFNNVSAAERVLDIVLGSDEIFYTSIKNTDLDVAFENSPKAFRKMIRNFRERHGGKDALYLDEFYEDAVKAMNDPSISDAERKVKRYDFVTLMRVADLFLHSKRVDLLAPEGYVVGDAGRNFGWGSESEIFKAVDVILNPNLANISLRLGKGNKVRNFYNNIVNPNSDNGELTADTHALGAATLNITSANDASEFGIFSQDTLGFSTPYAILKDAYARVAQKRGLKPREVQSAAWEAIKSLIDQEQKTPKNRKIVNDIWKRVQEKKLTYEEARNEIYRGGEFRFSDPIWLGKSRVDERAIGVDESAYVERGGIISDIRRLRGTTRKADSSVGTRTPLKTNPSRPNMMQKPTGTVYGFVGTDNNVYINSEHMNPNTPIHEYGHLWIDIIERDNKALFDHGISLINDSVYMDRVNSNEYYKDLPLYDRQKEALALAIGNRGESMILDSQKKNFKSWMYEFLRKIAELLGATELFALKGTNMTLDELLDGAVSDLLSGNYKWESDPLTQTTTPMFAIKDIDATVKGNPERENRDLMQYSADMAHTIVKELMQNSKDSIDEAISLGKISEGRIDLEVNNKTKTVRIEDNGHGMDTVALLEGFLTKKGTAKLDVELVESFNETAIPYLDFEEGKGYYYKDTFISENKLNIPRALISQQNFPLLEEMVGRDKAYRFRKSFKEGVSTGGGFGIAKISFLSTAEKIYVQTTRDGETIVLELSGRQFTESLNAYNTEPFAKVNDFGRRSVALYTGQDAVEKFGKTLPNGTIIELTYGKTYQELDSQNEPLTDDQGKIKPQIENDMLEHSGLFILNRFEKLRDAKVDVRWTDGSYEGEKEDIGIPETLMPYSFLGNFRTYVKLTDKWSREYKFEAPIGLNINNPDYILPSRKNSDQRMEGLPEKFITFETPNETISVYIFPEEYDSENGRPLGIVLSNGAYQFSVEGGEWVDSTYPLGFNPRRIEIGDEYKKFPHFFIINIQSKVKAGMGTYAFYETRERFASTGQTTMNKYLLPLFKTIIQLESLGKTVDVYSEIEPLMYIPPKARGTGMFRDEEVYLPYAKDEWRKAIKEHKEMLGNQPVKVKKTLDQMPKGLVVDIQNQSDIVKFEGLYGKVVKDSGLPINKDFVFLSNNTTLDVSGQKNLLFFSKLGSQMKEMLLEISVMVSNKDNPNISSAMRVLDQENEDTKVMAGVFIDKKASGVSVVKPYNAVFVNPYMYNFPELPLFAEIDGRSRVRKDINTVTWDILDTMLHEFLHIPNRDHGQNFSYGLAQLKKGLKQVPVDKNFRVDEKYMVEPTKGEELNPKTYAIPEFRNQQVKTVDSKYDEYEYYIMTLVYENWQLIRKNSLLLNSDSVAAVGEGLKGTHEHKENIMILGDPDVQSSGNGRRVVDENGEYVLLPQSGDISLKEKAHLTDPNKVQGLARQNRIDNANVPMNVSNNEPLNQEELTDKLIDNGTISKSCEL